MFALEMTKTDLAQHVSLMSDDDFARFIYCQHMASTYMAVHQLEDQLVSAMLMCDRIRVSAILQEDSKAWQMLSKKKSLQSSTLGSLIAILDRHEIHQQDISYLRWLKNKRDHFIHRLFHEGDWPGDLDAHRCRAMTRKLMATQYWFSRAHPRIWGIFERAGFIVITDLKENGLLIANADLFNDSDL